MSEVALLRYCAPTLAGLKTGSMFTAEYRSEEDLWEDLAGLNELLRDKGLVITCLRYRSGTALIYIYRPERLQRDLAAEQATDILRRRGYDVSDALSCVRHLSRRVTSAEDFPHEVGFFLGYPPEDVKGFIENGARGSKASGMWKVYGDVAQAEALFQKFSKCTKVYLNCWQRGVTLSRLAVSQN